MQKSKEFKIFSADGGFRVVRRASREQAEMFEAMEIWRREYDPGTGALLGFRVIGVESRKADSELPSLRTTSSISSREAELNLERSRTFGLREDARLERVKNGLLPEDPAERAQAKIRVWPLVGAARGSILLAWR